MRKCANSHIVTSLPTDAAAAAAAAAEITRFHWAGSAPSLGGAACLVLRRFDRTTNFWADADCSQRFNYVCRVRTSLWFQCFSSKFVSEKYIVK